SSVGTGPFVYRSFTPGHRSVFTANPHYWGHAPYVNTLVVDSSFTNDNARVNAALAGQVDIVTAMPYALAKANASSGTLRIGSAPGSGFQNIVCRVDVEPFRDGRVLQALKMLINRPVIIASAFSGYATVSNDCPQSGQPFFASDIEPYAHDVEQAKA